MIRLNLKNTLLALAFPLGALATTNCFALDQFNEIALLGPKTHPAGIAVNEPTHAGPVHGHTNPVQQNSNVHGHQTPTKTGNVHGHSGPIRGSNVHGHQQAPVTHAHRHRTPVRVAPVHRHQPRVHTRTIHDQHIIVPAPSGHGPGYGRPYHGHEHYHGNYGGVFGLGPIVIGVPFGGYYGGCERVNVCDEYGHCWLEEYCD